MKKELGLQCHYKVTFDQETFTYSFTTANFIEYSLAFLDASYLFDGTSAENSVKAFNLNIEKLSEAPALYDIFVQEAVTFIIRHFFEDTSNVLIYICDSTDSKEKARWRKFNMWFDADSFKMNLVKLDGVISADGVNHYTTIIFHKDNSKGKFISIGFYELVEVLTKP